MQLCQHYKIPVKVLTKMVSVCLIAEVAKFEKWDKNLIAFGFTLTGHDELEPNANTNAERIEAMRKLHEAGFKTWASIEPVIDFESSYEMIRDCGKICNLLKIGLESGKEYDKKQLKLFIEMTIEASRFNLYNIYFKDSLLKQAGINREDLPSNCVGRDYNMFNN
jgi:DNA repair photolyase